MCMSVADFCESIKVDFQATVMVITYNITLSMQAIQNLGLSVFIIVAGVIVERLGYLYLEVILQIVLSLALFAGTYSGFDACTLC